MWFRLDSSSLRACVIFLFRINVVQFWSTISFSSISPLSFSLLLLITHSYSLSYFPQNSQFLLSHSYTYVIFNQTLNFIFLSFQLNISPSFSHLHYLRIYATRSLNFQLSLADRDILPNSGSITHSYHLSSLSLSLIHPRQYPATLSLSLTPSLHQQLVFMPYVIFKSMSMKSTT